MLHPRKAANAPEETSVWARGAAAPARSETPLSLAHLTVLDAAPPALIDLAYKAGCAFAGLRLVPVTEEEPVWPLVTDTRLLRETKHALAATGVGVLDVELVRLLPELVVAELEPLLETSAELGARRVLTQVHDPDLFRAGGRYWELCERAKIYGLTCDIEFLTWTGMRDVASALAFIRSVGHSHGGLCIDTLHFARSGCVSQEIGLIPEQWLHFAQVCDAPAQAPVTREGLIEAAREDRLWPGEGALPLRQIIAQLPAGMPLALEIPNRKLALVMTPEARVGAAADAMRALLADVQECQSAHL